jgi:hypothetical protein
LLLCTKELLSLPLPYLYPTFTSATPLRTLPRTLPPATTNCQATYAVYHLYKLLFAVFLHVSYIPLKPTQMWKADPQEVQPWSLHRVFWLIQLLEEEARMAPFLVAQKLKVILNPARHLCFTRGSPSHSHSHSIGIRHHFRKPITLSDLLRFWEFAKTNVVNNVHSRCRPRRVYGIHRLLRLML